MSKKKKRHSRSDSSDSSQTRVDSAHKKKAKTGQTLLAALAKQAERDASPPPIGSTADNSTVPFPAADDDFDEGQAADLTAETEQNETDSGAADCNSATDIGAIEDRADNLVTHEADEKEADEKEADDKQAVENGAVDYAAELSEDEIQALKPKLRVDSGTDTSNHSSPAPHHDRRKTAWLPEPNGTQESVGETVTTDPESDHTEAYKTEPNHDENNVAIDSTEQAPVVKNAPEENKPVNGSEPVEQLPQVDETSPAVEPATVDESEELADAKSSAEPQPAAVDSGTHEPSSGAIEEDAGQRVAAEIRNANLQLQLQASQLAGHLQERKFDLQRRENEVNAQLASWDAEHREVELVFQQRAVELSDREADLNQREADVECQLTEVATAAVTAERERQRWLDELEKREQTLNDRESDLKSLQNQLHRQQAALVGFQQQTQVERERAKDQLRLEQQHWSAQLLAEREQLSRLQSNVEQNRAQLAQERLYHEERTVEAWEQFLERCEAESEERRQHLEDEETRVKLLESIFTERTEELTLEQAALLAERREWEADREQQYKTLADRQRSGHEDLEKRRRELDKRQRFLEKRTEALEVLQSDVSKLHKACLEMRLVTEQVWADLSDRADAGHMTHRIAQARRQWSEFVQDELQQVDDRKKEVAGLLTKLQEEHNRLNSDKGEFRKWIDRRYREIEEQAARLITRQRELNEEAIKVEQSKKASQNQEKQLRNQILDLQAQLNQRRAA